jgi:hypothetical protein
VFGRVELLFSGHDDTSHHGLLKSLLAVTRNIECSVTESSHESNYKIVDPDSEETNSVDIIEEEAGEQPPAVNRAVGNARNIDADTDIPGSTTRTT